MSSRRQQQTDADSKARDDGSIAAGNEQSASRSGVEVEEIAATPDMCHYCFDILLKELLPESSSRQTKKPTKTDTSSSDGGIIDMDDVKEKLEARLTYTPPEVDCPLFVTWSKLRSENPPPPLLSAVSSSGVTTPASTTTASSSNITDEDENNSTTPSQQQKHYDESDYDLRGCIGTLAPKSLKYALSEFAITSALHDTRFAPIPLSELPYLRVGVSLLVKYEVCEHCLDWQVGVHGIIIKFKSKVQRASSIDYGHTYSATYLPEVAYEQQWSQQEAVLSLIRKAGYCGVISDELLEHVRCTRYQSSKCRLSYQEYAMARHQGVDPLANVNGVVTAAAVDEAIRQNRGKASKTCVNL